MDFKKYYVLIILLILLITPLLNASVVTEKKLNDFNYSNFVVVKDSNLCKTYNIPVLINKEHTTSVLQLKINNYIPINSGVSISVYLNSKPQVTIKNNKIKENNIIYLDNLDSKENKLTICVDNNFLPKLSISSQSKIGNYLLPNISKKNFVQTIPVNEYYKNTTIPIKITVKNTGYDSQYITVINATKEFVKNSELNSSSGNISYEGEIRPNETKEITYYVKTNDAVNQITPRAILEYTNDFNIPIKIYTEPKAINITDNPSKLNAYIDVPRNIIINKDYDGKLILRNISQDNLSNLYITPNFDAIIKMKEYSLQKLKGNDVIEIPFTIRTLDLQKHKLSFKVTYDENNVVSTQTINIFSKKPNNDYNVLVGVLIIIALILIIWSTKL